MKKQENEIIEVNASGDIIEKAKIGFSYEPPTWWQQIKKHLYFGLLASVLLTTIWFFAMEKVRSVAIAILLAAVVVFVLRGVMGLVLAKKPGKVVAIANIISTLIIVIVFFSVTVVALSPKLLFYPNFNEEAHQTLTKHVQTEELTIRTENGTLGGWLLHQSDEKAPLVLYFGGNGESSAARLEALLANQDTLSAFAGCHFACVDYPGYGKSEGTPSDKSLQQYALDVYDYLINREEVSEIIVLSYSLGTGVANYLASERVVDGLIMMAPYADGYDLFNGMLNIFHGPLRLLVTYKMEAVEFAKDISEKPLILATPTDEMVPYASSRRLFQEYPNGCDFVTVDGIGHNDFWETQMVLEKIKEYIKERK